MKIIGAGFGRTGTMSMAVALEHLGLAPCYHMLEVFKHPSHIKKWQTAADGEPIDWVDFLNDYQAGLDYPLAAFYKELMAAFPNAKVILTVRDAQGWYESTRQTIYQGTVIPDWILRLLPGFRGMKRMIQAAIWERIFQDRFEDKAYAINVFESHTEDVKGFVPPERLLVFNVRDGWKPLCDFLEVPIPDRPFPHINDRKFTQRGYRLTRMIAPILIILAIGLLAILFQTFVG
jgi:hypothetical protein